MTECHQTSIEFPSVKRRRIEADFSGGDIAGHTRATLLSRVDQKLGLTRAVALSLDDSDREASCDHKLAELLKQRIGAVVIRNTRRVRLLMSSAYPHQDLFRQVAWRLNSS